MDDAQTKRVLEALLLVSEKSLLVEQVREVLGSSISAAQIQHTLEELAQEYEQSKRGIRIVEVAGGFQLITDTEMHPFVSKLTKRVRTVRLTKPSLETLAIIAYRQPLTRAEIEQIRGVDVSGVLDTLLRLSVVRVAGRKEAVGRPLLYGTTREFLDHFGLKSLKALPTLKELQGDLKELPEVAAIEEVASSSDTVETSTEGDSEAESVQEKPAEVIPEPSAQGAPQEAPLEETKPE